MQTIGYQNIKQMLTTYICTNLGYISLAATKFDSRVVITMSIAANTAYCYGNITCVNCAVAIMFHWLCTALQDIILQQFFWLPLALKKLNVIIYSLVEDMEDLSFYSGSATN